MGVNLAKYDMKSALKEVQEEARRKYIAFEGLGMSVTPCRSKFLSRFTYRCK
jgi:hypothetical protein